MNLALDKKLVVDYSSTSQIVRVLTESWVSINAFCPVCGGKITKYENNKPVADFCCALCKEDFELKSKKDTLGIKIVDGAYKTMIERLQSSSNPNFFLLNYNSNYSVTNFFIIPKHFFVPKIIEKRRALSLTARRAGWVGCNILLNGIPESGKIYYVKEGLARSAKEIIEQWKKTSFLRSEKDVQAKGWLIDVMSCIEKNGRKEFVLSDIYKFEKDLNNLHPDNHHIKDKIRQQLQILRDNGYLSFLGSGSYSIT